MTTYRNRADLMKHPAFAHLGTDTDGNPCVWRNHFTCNACTSEQVDWTDEWSCQCSDDCPNCDAETEPHTSTWIANCTGDRSDESYRLWEGLPDAIGLGWGASVVEPAAKPAPIYNCLPEGENINDMARRNHWRAIDIRFCRNIAADRNDDTFGTDFEVCEPFEAEIATIYAYDDLGEATAIHDADLNAAGADDLARVTRDLFMAILNARRDPPDAAQRHQAERHMTAEDIEKHFGEEVTDA